MFTRSLKELTGYNKARKSVAQILKEKIIAICDCRKGKPIGNQSRRRLVEHKDGFCIYCKHAVQLHRVAPNWKPEDGLGEFKKMVCVANNRKKRGKLSKVSKE